jgi:hypothetical protein
MVHIFFEGDRRFVEVFIKNIRGPASDAGGGNHLKFGIGRFDRVVELSKTTIIIAGTVEEVFVADLDVLNTKRLRMAICRALCSPVSIGSAGSVFDFIDGILYVRRQVRSRIYMFTV